MKFSSLLLLLFIPAAGHFAEATGCTLRSHQLTGYRLDGDVMIGGIFPASYTLINEIPSFTESPAFTICNQFYMASLVWAEALAFTIEEINREQLILPNITLGFVIFDTCLSLPRALQGTMWILTGKPISILNYRCQSSAPLAAFVGDAASDPTILIARLLGIYKYPQVSYFASSPLLKNKYEFPSLLRTISSGEAEAVLLYYMKKVRFKSKSGEEMYFDSSGEPPAQYDIVNWQMKPDNTLQHVKVGDFDVRASVGKQLYINNSAVQWNMQRTEVPRSVCSESCGPGYRKAHQEGRPACCIDCIPCAEGEIANGTDSSTCWQCPGDKWPNERRSECVPKRIEYLSYNEPLGSTLTTTTSLSFFTTAAVLCVFIKYRETAIVKANNRELSYLLLGSIALSFLSSLLFIGEPHPTTCRLQHLAFGIIFVLCVSCVLAKTIMVVIAFNATKPDSNMRKWLGPKVPVVTVSVCTLFQVLTCAIWLLLCPPFPEKNMKIKTGTIVLQCNKCSEIALWFMLGYMGLLACASFLVAFVSRNLPDSFNEAKWITFSMIVFLSVWFSFIPGYLSTQGKNMVAVEVFSIIASSAGLLSCIFLPKCYIILLRPELNTRENLLGRGRVKPTKTSIAL
ncbi:extracellular calcium-sensing receptor-like [Lissotriton helveticus]